MQDRLLEVGQARNLSQLLGRVSLSMHVMQSPRFTTSYHYLVSWLKNVSAEKLGGIGVDISRMLPVVKDEYETTGFHTFWHRVHDFFQADQDELLVIVTCMGIPITMFWSLLFIIAFDVSIVPQPYSTYVFYSCFFVLGVVQLIPLALHVLGKLLVRRVEKKFAHHLEEVALMVGTEKLQSLKNEIESMGRR